MLANLDQWDGYAPQRARLLGLLAQRQVSNPVVLTGDIHSTWISELRVAFDQPIKNANPILNPHVRYFDGSKRGYLRCVLDRDTWRTDVRVVDTIDVPVSPVYTNASFVVRAGSSTVTPD